MTKKRATVCAIIILFVFCVVSAWFVSEAYSTRTGWHTKTSLTLAELRWAYGDGWQSSELPMMPLFWNDKHSDLFIINGTDSVEDTEKRIKLAYKAR